MPGFTCCVPGCYNNSHRDRELRFYTFPKDPMQREIWLKNISRAGVSGCFSTFQPTTGHRVCSVHFPGGRKTYTIRVPTLFPLRGVNERKSRRGRNRKVSAALPGATGTPLPIITSVVSAVASEGEPATPGGADTDSSSMVQIGQNGQYITSPIDLTAQTGEASCLTAAVTGGSAEPALLPQAGSCPAVPGGGSYAAALGAGTTPDHSYSLGTGTSSAELLKKLNEQRDILALMEVKMKEMKSTIRTLRITEARLQEELRDRDRMLSNTGVRKKI